MRLRQLSRKLEVDTEKIINHLKASNLACEDDSNAKLSDEQVTLLIKAFGPIDEAIEEEPETIAASVVESKVEVVEEEPIVEIKEVEAETTTAEAIADNNTKLSEVISSLQENQEQATVEPDVIRAPKVELTGLKVVGKIELRTPKKKEASEEEETAKEKVELPKTSKVRFNGRNDRQKRKEQPRKNSLSIAEQRKREEKIKQRKKREAEALAKKKKKENYLKKVKAKGKGKEKIEIKRTKPELSEKQPARQSSKNVGLFTKFFNWMRRE